VTGPPPASWSVDPDDASAQLCAPGLWRLRLPLPWPGNGHVNAYTVERGDGIILVDCGTAGHPNCALALSAALAQSGHAVTDVRAFVATHAHSDHVGLASWVQERSDCEVWMHRDIAHFYDAIRDPGRIAAARERRARQEGVPEEMLEHFRDVREELEGALGYLRAGTELRDGIELPSELGNWEVVETPGHAPSHVCLVQREHGFAFLGDMVCSVFVPWFDYGYTLDPIAEFLSSLDRLEELGPLQQSFPGHGRPIRHLEPILADHRAGVAKRLTRVRDAVEKGGPGPLGAYALSEQVFGRQPSAIDAVEKMTETAVYLRHLRMLGEVQRFELEDGAFRYELTARRG
jgi:glyoxylase-like metal-dependent hydrolase (beta-lactamase superfamily II)